MRLETVVEMDFEILDGHHRSLVEWLIWKETSLNVAISF